MNDPLYFDCNGSTPVHPAVLEAFLAATRETPGNAAAAHPAGRAAREAIERARAQVADALGAAPDEITFTSGGTESNNWALFGTAEERGRGHVIVSAIEHRSVLSPARALGERGFHVHELAPEPGGAVSLAAVEARMRLDTVLVAVMTANNETGVVQPVGAIAELCRERGVRFHTDAVAALGKMPLDVREIECDTLSLSAHKMYAPKGVGVLYVRGGVSLRPWMLGCGQQCGRRSGTENTAGAVAFGQAMELCRQGKLIDVPQLATLRDRLWMGLRARFPGAERNGSGEVLANTLNVHFPGWRAVELQSRLGELGISVSAGASASSGEPSHVLVAMGCSPQRARSSLRFSLGIHTTASAIDRLLGALEDIGAGSRRTEMRA